MLITWALWSAAKRIPFAMLRAVPKPSESSTRTGMIFAREREAGEAEAVAGALRDRPGDVSAVPVLVEGQRSLSTKS